MNTQRIYEDKAGIRYKFVGFHNGKFQMEVVDSPVAEISEGIVVEMNELPSKTKQPA